MPFSVATHRLAQPPAFLSILYLRCAYLRLLTMTPLYTIAFNSLFEMHRGAAAVPGAGEQHSFNSLFEMRLLQRHLLRPRGGD